MIRSKLKYAGDIFPSPNRITTWNSYWDYVGSYYPRGVPRPTGYNPELSTLARIDEGRWVADCPWGCGAAFNLQEDVSDFWCTECVGGGLGLSCNLVWPKARKNLTTNLETLPAMLQYWPCAPCIPKAITGSELCETDRGMLGGGN
jgi:hypothetical protein